MNTVQIKGLADEMFLAIGLGFSDKHHNTDHAMEIRALQYCLDFIFSLIEYRGSAAMATIGRQEILSATDKRRLQELSQNLKSRLLVTKRQVFDLIVKSYTEDYTDKEPTKEELRTIIAEYGSEEINFIAITALNYLSIIASAPPSNQVRRAKTISCLETITEWLKNFFVA